MSFFTDKEIIEIKTTISSYNVDVVLKSTENKRDTITYELKDNTDVYFRIKKNTFFMVNFPVEYCSMGSIEMKSLNSFDKVKIDLRNWLFSVRKNFPYSFKQQEEINEFSPKFYPTFKDAIKIQNIGFEDASGMIYRKALEFLSKDFLVLKIPQNKELVLNKTIGSLFSEFYTKNFEVVKKYEQEEELLNDIKPLFKFISDTFKIGNDFAHYERKLEHFSPKDMRENIEKILKYIMNDVKILNLKEENDKSKNEFIDYQVNSLNDTSKN